MKLKKYSSFIVSVIILTFLLSGCSNNQIQYETNAYIKDWLIVGPFPNCTDCSTEGYQHDERCEGFFTDYLESIGGEKNAVPTEGMKVKYSEKNIEKTWFKIHNAENIIHLTFLEPKDMVVAYAFCQIESPKKQKTILSIGSNDGVRVFLNGEEVHESHDFKGRLLQADKDYVPVDLKKGKNNLMLKIDQGTVDFGYAARFLDYDSVIAEIRKSIETYKTLKVVAIEDTLITSFGTGYKMSILNPNGKVKIELSHEKKGKLTERTIALGVDTKFVLANIPKGFITVKASFQTPNDGVITSETKYYNGKLKKHPRVSRVTKDLTIIDKDGKPIFPIGTYGAPVEDYKVLKDAGYNFVVTSVENLDKVHEAGLLAAIHVSGKTPQDYFDFITKYKDHPAILCWMMYDEPGYNKADLLYIYDIYNAAYKADKIHPSYLVITLPTVYKTFGRCSDVLAIDTYPITGGIIEDVGEDIALAYDQLDNEIPIWHCGQMFSWPEHRRPNPRRPNPQEHRFMTYYPLMKGVKGLLWYTFKGYGQNLPIDDPVLWKAQKTLLKEISELIPLFLEPGFGTKIELTENSKTIKAIIKKSRIGTFAIAANISETETFQSELKVSNTYNGKVSVYNENREVDVKNGIIKDEFKPLDVHIYKLSD